MFYTVTAGSPITQGLRPNGRLLLGVGGLMSDTQYTTKSRRKKWMRKESNTYLFKWVVNFVVS